MTTRHEKTIEVPIVYYKKSATDYSEGERESYPKVSVQDYMPTYNDMWHNYPEGVSKRLAGYRDEDGDGKIDTVDWIPDPFMMEFRFLVSCAAKSSLEFYVLTDYFNTKFGKKGTFSFNKIPVIGTEPIADYVDYSVTPNEIERSDGVYEASYDFVLKVWVQAKDKVTYNDLLEELNISLNIV